MAVDALLRAALNNLLSELIEGPKPDWAWVIDPTSPGLLPFLDQFSADDASRRPAHGGSTIAAHANHLRFSLELLNRWARGEENPFADADWNASWNLQTVSDSQWHDLRKALRREASDWIAAAQTSRDWNEITLTGAFASAAHLAYHLSALRQLAAARRTR